MGSEIKHTPGPWRETGQTGRVMSEQYSQPFGVSGTGDHRGQLICGCFGDVRGGAEQAKANAKLIAAAPELLKALEDMLWHMPEGEEKQTAPWVKAARAAITKATT